MNSSKESPLLSKHGIKAGPFEFNLQDIMISEFYRLSSNIVFR